MIVQTLKFSFDGTHEELTALMDCIDIILRHHPRVTAVIESGMEELDYRYDPTNPPDPNTIIPTYDEYLRRFGPGTLHVPDQ